MPDKKAVVFDLGMVLLRTDVRNLYQRVFDAPEEREFFLDNILTDSLRSSWNNRSSVREAVEELSLKFPDHRPEILMYYDRFTEILPEPIPGMPALVWDLHLQKCPMILLSNWSADTFEKTRSAYPFIELLNTKIVSGNYGFKKPDSRIFDILTGTLNLHGIAPHNAVYFDDKPANVSAGLNAGLDAHVFQNAEQARHILKMRDFNLPDPMVTITSPRTPAIEKRTFSC